MCAGNGADQAFEDKSHAQSAARRCDLALAEASLAAIMQGLFYICTDLCM